MNCCCFVSGTNELPFVNFNEIFTVVEREILSLLISFRAIRYIDVLIIYVIADNKYRALNK